MYSIKKSYQILAVAAGSPQAAAIFEVQSTHNPSKRMLVVRKSTQDPNVYFMTRADIANLNVFQQDVINMYENTWPTDLPTLGVDGQLGQEFNASFAQADFGEGRVGVVSFNGYDYRYGTFGTITKSGAASTATPGTEEDLQWFEKPTFKSFAWGALVLGVLSAGVAIVIRLFKRK